MNNLSATIPADQLPGVMTALLCLDKPGSRITEPINPNLVYLANDTRGCCQQETRGEPQDRIVLSVHEREEMRWLDGYPAEDVVSCSFHLMDVTGHITGDYSPGHVQLTRRDHGDFELLITELDGRAPRDLTGFPVELHEVKAYTKMEPIVERFLRSVNNEYRGNTDPTMCWITDIIRYMLDQSDPIWRDRLIKSLRESGMTVSLITIELTQKDEMTYDEIAARWVDCALDMLVIERFPDLEDLQNQRWAARPANVPV